MTTEPIKRRRHWYQFSLRTLLIGVLVLSLPLSWLACRMQKARRQREAVEAIRKLHVGVGYEGEPEQWLGLSDPSQPLWLRELLGRDFFDDVRSVEFVGLRAIPSDVYDHDLRHLADLGGLEELDLSGTRITDAGLTHIGRLVTLTKLDLMQNTITDRGLMHLVLQR